MAAARINRTGRAPVLRRGENTAEAARQASNALGSAATASAAAGVFLPYRFPSMLDAALRKLVSIELFESVDGVTLTWPTSLNVYEFARDALDRLRARIYTYTAPSTYTVLLSESAAGGTYKDMTGLTGEQVIDLKVMNTSLGVPTNTVVGKMRFVNDAAFGNYTVPYNHSVSGLYLDKMLPSTVEAHNIDARIEAQMLAAAEEERQISPFVATVADDYLRAVVKDLRIEHGDAGHEYIANLQTGLIGGTTYRFKLIVTNVTLGIVACKFELDSATNMASGLDVETRFLTQVNNGNPQASYTGTTATAWIDWDAVVWGTNASISAYTTYAQAGIRLDRVETTSSMLRFLDRAEPKRLLTVGATGADFTSVKDAVESLHDIPGLTVTTSSFPMSNGCTFSHQVMVEVMDDGWDEDMAGTVIPHFCTIRGRGPGNTVLHATAAPSTPRVFEGTFSHRLENLTLWQKGTGGYVIHSDNENALSKRATLGPALLRFIIMQAFADVEFRSDATASGAWAFGCGFSNGQRVRFTRCLATQDGGATAAVFGFHNSPGTTDPGVLEFEGVETNDDVASGSGVALLTSFDQDVRHAVQVTGSRIEAITHGNGGAYAGSDVAWVRRGANAGTTFDAALAA